MARIPFVGSGTTQQGGFSATHKQDFNAHVEGGGFNHLAEQITLSPNISGQTNVQDILESINSTIASISHTSLTNLTSDDHLQYLNRSGVRAMTGDFHIASFKITAADGVLTQDVISTDGSANIVIGSVGGNPVNVFSTNVNLTSNNLTASVGNTLLISCGGNISIFADDETSGDISILSGFQSGSAPSGNLSIKSGDTINGSVGNIDIICGLTDSGAGGSVSLAGSNSGSISGGSISVASYDGLLGGNVYINSGVGSVSSNNGSIVLLSGSPVAETLQIKNHTLTFKTSGTSFNSSPVNIGMSKVSLPNSAYGLVVCKSENGLGDQHINFECLHYTS